MPSWFSYVSPWIGFIAVFLCSVLVLRTVLLIQRAADSDSRVAWYSAGGAVVLAAIAIFFFFFSTTAGEAKSRPYKKEDVTEMHEKAPLAPTKVQIKKDFKQRQEKTFQQTSKPVEDHANEANDSIDKALERARRNR